MNCPHMITPSVGSAAFFGRVSDLSAATGVCHDAILAIVASPQADCNSDRRRLLRLNALERVLQACCGRSHPISQEALVASVIEFLQRGPTELEVIARVFDT